MRFVIFEGPEVAAKNITVTDYARQTDGTQKELCHRTKPARPLLLGWRHYMLMTIRETTLETVTFTARPESAERTALGLRARFYVHGTWEQGQYLLGAFPAPRPEILAECGITPNPATQKELAI